MSLIVSDIHCNKRKLVSFLSYKQDEHHIVAGDICDMRYPGEMSYSDAEIMSLECLDILRISKASVLWGNHDIHYTDFYPIASSRKCGSSILPKKIINMYKEGFFNIAILSDGYLVTHAGLHGLLLKDRNLDTVVDWLNTYPEIINWVSYIRGGTDYISGPLWLDILLEPSDYAKIPQVFGHTRDAGPKIYNDQLVCIETQENICFNTKTKRFEMF